MVDITMKLAFLIQESIKKMLPSWSLNINLLHHLIYKIYFFFLTLIIR